MYLDFLTVQNYFHYPFKSCVPFIPLLPYVPCIPTRLVVTSTICFSIVQFYPPPDHQLPLPTRYFQRNTIHP